MTFEKRETAEMIIADCYAHLDTVIKEVKGGYEIAIICKHCKAENALSAFTFCDKCGGSF